MKLNTLTPKQEEKELQKLTAEFDRQVETGTYLDAGKITFTEFSEKWLHDCAEKLLQPKTVYYYKDMLSSRIFPCIGHVKLEKLQPTHLIDF